MQKEVICIIQILPYCDKNQSVKVLEVYSLFYDLVSNNLPILHISGIATQHKCTEEKIILCNPANPEEIVLKSMYISDNPIRNNLAEFLSSDTWCVLYF